MNSKVKSTKIVSSTFDRCHASEYAALLKESLGFEASFNGTHPRDPDFSRDGYLIHSLLTKLATSKVPPLERANNALLKFLAANEKNKRTNSRLLFMDGFIHGFSCESLLNKAREFASQIVGDITIEDVVKHGAFSGGASTSKRRCDASAYSKFRDKSDSTDGCLKYVKILLDESSFTRFNPSMIDEVNLVDHNVFFTVPKNAETDRGACKEPDWNMYFQKGVGSILRKRLKRFGIDLSDQMRNQKLAQIGSLDGSLATLDLSSASDLNSYTLVERILPFNLFEICCDLRCGKTKLPDGSIIEPDIFSSMGNGFTFEVETLIFYCLARSMAYHKGIRGTISVYGDDIIVPTELANSICDLLGYCGHIPNKEKSFSTGFFRESCGGHYYKGVCVTPFYVREPIKYGRDVKAFLKNKRGNMVNQTIKDDRRFIHFHNRLLKWATLGDLFDYRVQALLDRVKKKVSPHVWGGVDVESIDSLVTCDQPRKRWISVAKRVHHEDSIAYSMALLGHRTSSTISDHGASVIEAPGLIDSSTSLLKLVRA